MKRRNFLGFLTGAAVAGPAAAKEVVATVATPQASLLLAKVGGISQTELPCAPSLSKSSWTTQRLSELARQMSGMKTIEERHYESARRAEELLADKAQNVSVLRSVSATSRVRMFRIQRAAVEQDSQMQRWLAETFRLTNLDVD